MTDERIKRVLMHIERHVAEPVDLHALAGIACLSDHHFHRLFKAQMGETPKAYVDRVRMEHVAHMMVVRKDINLTDLAFDYGYSSPAAFTRAFRAIYDMAPRTFRTQMRAQHRERLEHYWASLEAGDRTAPRRLELNHLPSRRYRVVRASMEPAALNAAYRQLILDNAGRVSHGVTIYTESPFQANREAVRLHIGLDEQVAAADRNTLELRAGYYYQQKVTGSFDAMVDQMFETFQRDIEPSRYRVASTTFFERVSLPASAGGFDYFNCERTIFGCLERG